MWVPLTESGIVIYNWSSQIANALNLEIGDPVDIIEETDSWFRGSTRRSKKPGIFPKNIVYCKKNLNYDNVVNECTEILREWFDIWKRLYV
uniref:SH3 domain-containing protein n=1 Tax=Megaselia scalaris TaxID=36166 RepID=T1H0P2_MEGSC